MARKKRWKTTSSKKCSEDRPIAGKSRAPGMPRSSADGGVVGAARIGGGVVEHARAHVRCGDHAIEADLAEFGEGAAAFHVAHAVVDRGDPVAVQVDGARISRGRWRKLGRRGPPPPLFRPGGHRLTLSTVLFPMLRARPSERRLRQRSPPSRGDDSITALHYQLSHTRAEAGLDVVVLVDDFGLLVAGAGAWPHARSSPRTHRCSSNRAAIGGAAVGSRIAAIEPEVEVTTLSIDGMGAVLCGRGDPSRRGSIARAAAGCRRILVG